MASLKSTRIEKALAESGMDRKAALSVASVIASEVETAMREQAQAIGELNAASLKAALQEQQTRHERSFMEQQIRHEQSFRKLAVILGGIAVAIGGFLAWLIPAALK